jgi:hypothetical protein
MSTAAAGSTTLERPATVAVVDGLDPALAAATDARGQAARRRAVLGLVAIAALGVAFALVEQDPGPAPVAHFALVRALADGTAEIGPGVTIDSAYIGGRYYANKAPGLAFALLPAYLGLRQLGLQPRASAAAGGGAYRHRLWELTLFGAVLPAVVLMLLMLVAVERLWPGYGPLTAILLGAGTLLLPFATLLFGHVLSATLGFAAFVVLLLERDRPTVWRAWLAGLLAGFAVVVEYPLAIVALVLAGYVASRSAAGRRLAAYAGGCLIGVLPLAAYNTWAFGSPTTMSYTNVIEAPSGTGPPTLGSGNSTGFYGVTFPDLRAALTLLLSEKGLFVVAPLCVVALCGLPLLWRAGRRAETIVCAAVPALFLTYNAAYFIPFGGQGPGPRFLVPALPFLALPLAATLRRSLPAALLLGLVSIGVMALATATAPLVTGADHALGDWSRHLRHGDLMASSLLGDGSPALVPAALLVVLALCLALAGLAPDRDALRPGLVAVLVVPAWIVTAVAAPKLLPADAAHGTRAGTLAVVCLVVAIAAGLALVARRGSVVAVGLAPLALLALPAVNTRQQLSLLVAAAALGLVAVLARPPRLRIPAPG